MHRGAEQIAPTVDLLDDVANENAAAPVCSVGAGSGFPLAIQGGRDDGKGILDLAGQRHATGRQAGHARRENDVVAPGAADGPGSGKPVERRWRRNVVGLEVRRQTDTALIAADALEVQARHRR